MAKKILHGEEARQALKRGIDAVANVVRITIGPRGRNVVLDKAEFVWPNVMPVSV